MSEQLLGVLVGAFIGFAGTALITLLGWRIEKEKRREDRLWHYRQEHMQRMRPAWDTVHRQLRWFVTFLDDDADLMDRMAATKARKGEKEWEEIEKEFGKHVDSIPDLQQIGLEFGAAAYSLRTIPDPALSKSIERNRELLETIRDVSGELISLGPKILHNEELSPAVIAKISRISKRMRECRRLLLETIREQEASIERYITMHDTPLWKELFNRAYKAIKPTMADEAGED